MTDERWKDVTGYEGLYKVSNKGNVLTIRRNRLLTQQWVGTRANNKYLMVYLTKNSKKATLAVHRLVAIHFIDNPDGLKEVNHIKKDKSNNNDWNLEWSTSRENNSHKNIGGGSSKYVGVCWDKTFRKWNAYITINKKRTNLGYFKIETEAASAYLKCLSENGLKNKYAHSV